MRVRWSAGPRSLQGQSPSRSVLIGDKFWYSKSFSFAAYFPFPEQIPKLILPASVSKCGNADWQKHLRVIHLPSDWLNSYSFWNISSRSRIIEGHCSVPPINYRVDKKITLQINISGDWSDGGGGGRWEQHSTGLSAQPARRPSCMGRSEWVYTVKRARVWILQRFLSVWFRRFYQTCLNLVVLIHKMGVTKTATRVVMKNKWECR